ncbi:uncharacterized protein LOC133652321 isoform X2 [Entelurus aequoreus]|uniref:uncharacterized protein LOC133652321 isoform X2 n=1 Tax=Entelurus aequoreus TaxID=161455 RepID=UPI002B1CE592|nr:uncharacterized protein LOC133652321 isoform X2 [Entelurus aequoreus]
MQSKAYLIEILFVTTLHPPPPLPPHGAPPPFPYHDSFWTSPHKKINTRCQNGQNCQVPREEKREKKRSRKEKKTEVAGEALQVRAKIINQSNHSVKPTYILYWKQTGIFPGQRMISMIPILAEEAKPVAAHSRKTVTKMITIPRGMPPSISTRPAVKNEYILKVHLDMKGTSVTKVKIPIFVLSNSLDSQRQQLLDEVDPGFPGYDNTKSDGRQPKTGSRSLDVPLNFKDI